MKRGKDTSNEKGKRGVGNLIKLDEQKLRIDFEDGDKTPITISVETVPEILLNVLKKMPNNSKVGVEVTLDISGEKILFVKPLVGTFDLKFVKFYAPEGSLPAPETKMGKGNKPYKQFSAVLEVQNITGKKSDMWKGVRYNVMFFDNFGKDEDGNLLVLAKGDNSDFLNDFMDASGAGFHEIPFSENPLPEIEKIILMEDKVISADVRKTVSKDLKSYANIVTFNTYDLAGDFEEVGFTEEVKPEEPKEEIHPALKEE